MGKKRIWILCGAVLLFVLGAVSGYCYGTHAMKASALAEAEQRAQLEFDGNAFCDQIGQALESHDLAWLTEHYAAEVPEERFSVYEALDLTYRGAVPGETRALDSTGLSRDYTLQFACPPPLPQTLRDSLPAYEVMEIEETGQLSILVHVEKGPDAPWSYVIQSFP